MINNLSSGSAEIVMNKNTMSRPKFIFASFLMLLTILSCELITPDAYTESENSISNFDNIACNLMSRDFISVDTVRSGSDTSVVIDTLYIELEASSDDFTELLDSLIFEGNSSDVGQLSALYDSISAETRVIVMDTTNLVELGGRPGYLYFPNNTSGEFTVFVSWAFTGKNVSDYVSVDFINESGIQANIDTQDMPLETISGCIVEYTVNDETGEISHTPAIKTRTSFGLDSNPYLMRISRTQFIAGTPSVPLYIAILQND